MKTVEETLQEIDAPEPARQVWQLAGLIERAMADLEKAGQTEDARALSVDWAVCRMVVRAVLLHDPFEGDNKKRPRLTGYLGNSDGSSYPDPGWLTLERKGYLSRRSNETGNPILRAHYKDVLFESTKRDDAWKPRRPQLAGEAVEAYLQSARLFAAADLGLAMVVALDHAAHLSMLRGMRAGDDRLAKVVGSINELLESQAARDISKPEPPWPRGRWVDDLARLVGRIRRRCGARVVPNTVIHRAEQVCLQFAELHSNGRPWDETEFRRTLRELADARNDHSAAHEAEMGRLQALEKAAEERAAGPAGDPLAAAGILQQVVEGYEELLKDQGLTTAKRARIDDRIGKLRHRVRDTYRGARGRIQTFEVPLNIPQDELNELLDDLLKPEDIHECLDRIASEGSLLPNVEAAERQAREFLSGSGLAQLTPTTILADDIPVADAPGVRPDPGLSAGRRGGHKPAKAESGADSRGVRGQVMQDPNAQLLALERDRNLLLWIGLNSHVILNELFRRLREKKGLNAGILIEHFDRWGLLDEDNREIVLAGFERYIAGDGIAAMHILAPQFEDVFRSVLERAGAFVIQKQDKGDGWRFDVSLNTMLGSPHAENIPRDVREYIRLVFSAQYGWNLGNRVAHGLVLPAQCILPMVETVLHLFLLLALMRVETPSTPPVDSGDPMADPR